MTSLACRMAGLSLCATVACVVAGSAVAGDPLTSQQSVADPNDARCNAMGEGFYRRRRLERLRQDQRLRRRRRRFRRRLAHGFAQFRPVRRRAGLGARDASRGQRRRPLRYADRPGAGVCPDGPRHPPALTPTTPVFEMGERLPVRSRHDRNSRRRQRGASGAGAIELRGRTSDQDGTARPFLFAGNRLGAGGRGRASAGRGAGSPVLRLGPMERPDRQIEQRGPTGC